MATSSSSVAANMLDILHLTLSALAKLAAETLKDSDRKFNSLETRFPHIILLNWVYGVNPETRSRALVSLWIVEYVDDTECDPWMDFFTGALGGCLSNEHIANAIVRDLADEDTVDRELKNVLGFLSVRHDFTNNVEKNLPFNTLLAAYCLAAMRRQQCRGNRQELGLFLQSVAPWVFRNFYTGLEIRGRQCYAFFDSLCDWIMFSIEDNTTGLDANIMKITDWYLQHIANRAKDSRPKTVALRRASLTAWQAAADAMARHQLEKHPQWSGLVRLWSAIRTKMLPAPPAPVYAPFAPFERCAWRECLCSRHKPAHRMRMCKGCEQAFYCGTRCLERDWEDGSSNGPLRTFSL
ncbi:zinc finger MYND domain-containing protein [Phanerochaete sordida]|uniref:Zinc finger MYND domain-containing protein n=1 Tax=Phanerochaete sordida TaxID=48140 RepID=A0A9P3GFF7_9APHY|nr:zinc finger MYND domain-containing protein [Phanerochaete sordida]